MYDILLWFLVSGNEVVGTVRIYLFIDLYDNWIVILVYWYFNTNIYRATVRLFILVSGLCNILEKILTILCNDLFIAFFFVIEE